MNFHQELLSFLQSSGTEKTLRKGDYLLREGEIENQLYYIQSGAVRAFIFSGVEDISIRFGYEGSIINALSSFISGRPSEMSLQAIRKTMVYAIDKTSLMHFVQENRGRLKGYNELLELTIVQQIERETDLLTSAPAERLRRVLQRSPNLFQQVPLKYIASYLRMTPETLSRIRKS